MKTQTFYITPNERSANVKDMTKEIKVNCVGAVNRNNFATRSVRNDYYLIYLLTGGMTLYFNNREHYIKEGELIIIRPNIKYYYYTENTNVNYLWMHFTGFKAEETLSKMMLDTNKILQCGHSGSIIDLWKRMCNEFIINDTFFEDMTTCIFQEILTVFSRRVNSSSGKKHLLKSVLYIHENYAKKISISQLAEIENLSESYYRTVFSNIFKASPIEYITDRRIEAAAYMLNDTDKTLEEISSLVGYNDPYYFGKLFKKKMGVSPGKYRKSKQS